MVWAPPGPMVWPLPPWPRLELQRATDKRIEDLEVRGKELSEEEFQDPLEPRASGRIGPSSLHLKKKANRRGPGVTWAAA